MKIEWLILVDSTRTWLRLENLEYVNHSGKLKIWISEHSDGDEGYGMFPSTRGTIKILCRGDCS